MNVFFLLSTIIEIVSRNTNCWFSKRREKESNDRTLFAVLVYHIQ